MRSEIPGVTQFDEKGHEGNIAVVKAYVYAGGNMEYTFHEEKIQIKRAKNSLMNNPR